MSAYSLLKAFLRRCRCPTIPDLIKVIAGGLDKITAAMRGAGLPMLAVLGRLN